MLGLIGWTYSDMHDVKHELSRYRSHLANVAEHCKYACDKTYYLRRVGHLDELITKIDKLCSPEP